MPEDKELQKRIRQIEGLIHEIETVADPAVRAKTLELLQSLMDFHGAGVERMMELIAEAGEPGHAIFDNFAREGLVGSLLLLYGLHPLDLETRVMQALDKVRPYLASHGGDVSLLGIADGVVRLQLQGSCHGCPSSAMTLELAIEEAIYEAAPDVAAIEVAGVLEPSAPPGLVQLGKTRGQTAPPQQPDGASTWEEVTGLESLAQSSVRAMHLDGHSVIFCRLGEAFYAYGNHCPGCGQELHDARLEAAHLVCPTCGQLYDIVRAGRGLNQPELNLKALPLLIEQGQAKVALPR